MKNLKLNKLNRISDELKNAVRGGKPVVCSCKCEYANQGGSSTNDNGWANNALGINNGGEWFVLLDEVVIYG
ncbi:MAG: TIGR04149 family rSAM-modified RiPP [Candidatus Limimorpha sp.]